jgi:hypothetical protein
MTHVEKLLQDAAERSVVGHVSRAAERIVDDLVTEALKDKAFRREMIALVQSAVRRTFARLSADNGSTSAEGSTT